MSFQYDYQGEPVTEYGYWYLKDFQKKMAKKLKRMKPDRGALQSLEQDGQLITDTKLIQPSHIAGLVKMVRKSGSIAYVWIWPEELHLEYMQVKNLANGQHPTDPKFWKPKGA